MAIKRNSEILASDIEKELSKNYLRLVAVSVYRDGITCLANNDGSYTLSGTASSNAYFTIDTAALDANTPYKMLGCPIAGSESSYYLGWDKSPWYVDTGNGVVFTLSEPTIASVSIGIKAGTTCNSLIFKPTIINNLRATYSSLTTGYNSFLPGIKMELLWANDNLSRGFPSQTVNVKCGGSSLLLVEFKESNVGYARYDFIIDATVPGDTVVCSAIRYSELYVMLRSVTVGRSTDITFSSCYTSKTYGTYEQEDTNMIPMRIYRIV